MTQRWRSIVWCHWQVPTDVLTERFSPGVRADLFEESAWVGLVPFEMRDLRLIAAGRALPSVPTVSSFSEVNVRTYVVGPRGPGVWFDTLDASSALGSWVARLAWSLPYLPSRIVASASDGPSTRAWTVERRDGTTARVSVEAGSSVVDPTALDQFLTERYGLYARAWWSPKRTLWAPVAHDPWLLRDCDNVAVDAGVVRAAGYPVSDAPDHVMAGDTAVVRIGCPQLV